MTTTKPASAGRQAAAKTSKTPRVVDEVTLTRLPLVENKPSHPAAQFKGLEPSPGEVLEFTLAGCHLSRHRQ